MDLAEIQRYADNAREDLYLDGPNGVDWIFRNSILARREDAMYVDYVEADDGHQWIAPDDSDLFLSFNRTADVIRIAHALSLTGMTTPEGLAVVADIWRKIVPHPDMHWQEIREANKATLEALGEKGLLTSEAPAVYPFVIDQWTFPLYTLDLSSKKIDRETLKDTQRNWAGG